MSPDVWQALTNLAPISAVFLKFWAVAWAYVTTTKEN